MSEKYLVIDTSIAESVFEHYQMTAREIEVAILLIKGLDNKAIAKHLTLTSTTVKRYVNQILKKTGKDSRLQFAVSFQCEVLSIQVYRDLYKRLGLHAPILRHQMLLQELLRKCHSEAHIRAAWPKFLKEAGLDHESEDNHILLDKLLEVLAAKTG